MTNEKTPREPSRRKFIKYGVAVAGAVALGLAEYSLIGRPTPSARATASHVTPTRVDCHGHTRPELTADKVISLMDSAGISHMVLMGYGLVKGVGGQWQTLDPLTVSIYKQYPDRILPFVSTMYQAWHNQDERMLSSAESQLRTGIFKGVGEVMLRYYAKPEYDEPEVNNPADSPFIKKLSDIVVKYDAVMNVHVEPEPSAIQSLENLLDYNKELKLVWAHMGSTIGTLPAKSGIGEIMDRHRNLYTDISGIQPTSLAPSGGGRRATITDSNGKLLPEFKKILQDHNDRVLFGLDTPWQENWAEEPFKKWTEWAENVAAQLEVAGAAERIMHRNAEDLFKI